MFIPGNTICRSRHPRHRLVVGVRILLCSAIIILIVGGGVFERQASGFGRCRLPRRCHCLESRRFCQQVLGDNSATTKTRQVQSSLFDGKTLGLWKIVDDFEFYGHGEVEVKDGALVLEKGEPGTAIRYTGKVPTSNYEISLDAARLDGEDFFCALTFPVGDSFLSLVVGGWSGQVVGLSCIDGQLAIENETVSFKQFTKNQWYAIRLRVAPEKVEAWIDQEKVVDFVTTDRRLSIYFEQESVTPLGIATWWTVGAVKNIRLNTIEAP
jgi:hypothetical protein